MLPTLAVRQPPWQVTDGKFEGPESIFIQETVRGPAGNKQYYTKSKLNYVFNIF